MIRGIKKITGILIMLFVLSACADDNDIDIIIEDRGTFQVTISGDVNKELEGIAIFSQYVDDINQPEEFFSHCFLNLPLKRKAPASGLQGAENFRMKIPIRFMIWLQKI